MDVPRHQRRRRATRALSWALAGLAALTIVGRSDEARASERNAFARHRQLTWTAAPQLRLQPERARLMLVLPPEWMPRPDLGLLGRPFDPNVHWEFRQASRLMRATLGTSVHLHVSDPARAIDFGLSLMPRGAVAVLRFDPMSGRH